MRGCAPVELPGSIRVTGTKVLFDVNDFDETLPGPWEWDMYPMAMFCCSSLDVFAAEVVAELLDWFRRALLHLKDQDLLDVVLPLVGMAANLHFSLPAVDPGSRGRGRLDRLTGAFAPSMRSRRRRALVASLRVEVAALELAVALRAPVQDQPIERPSAASTVPEPVHRCRANREEPQRAYGPC